MQHFICPFCRETLKIPKEYLGRRGRCNHCGGRIALIGSENIGEVQLATKVAEEAAEEENARPKPPSTPKQRELLVKLGMKAADAAALDREKASERIDALTEAQRGREAPTEKQMAWLRKQGMEEDRIRAIASKAEASALIENMHLQPTPKQIEYLRDLGADGVRIARIKSRAEASALIDLLRRSAH
jgi:hypothetical protein